MKLNKALAIVKERRGGERTRVCFLVCGCQPLHLATFLQAHLMQRFPDDPVQIMTGLYGDLLGNLGKGAESSATSAAVVLEWSDLDSRLGMRSSGGWSNRSQADILATCRERFSQIAACLQKLASGKPVVIAPPSLPLPPIGNTISAQSSVFELELQHALASFLLQISQVDGVRVVQPSHIDRLAPGGSRLDAKMELLAGFPYTLPYASALAGSWVELLWPPPPKKGLITDLDDTLWSGMVGEAGVDAVSWDLEHHAQAYGLYQQMLDHLADCGVLLGVCSKNELAVVESALRRKDLFLDAETFFPVCAGWGPKSGSVAEILRVWNIDENSVVFIDDNPMELSEVQQVFPGLTCLPFPANDANKIWDLLGQLRDLFGKPFATEEDRLRRASLRATAWIRDSESQSSSPEFIRGLQGVVTLDYKKDAANHRALELLNKTNQFNLNGLRMNEGEWRAYMERPETILSVVSYQDKFGPLGRIGVVLGFRQDKVLKITHWAMSCRAFSRRLEYHTLDSLFRESNAEEIEFAFQPTERNQPLQDFFRNLGIRQDGACTYKLTQSQFLSRAEELPHKSEILR